MPAIRRLVDPCHTRRPRTTISNQSQRRKCGCAHHRCVSRCDTGHKAVTMPGVAPAESGGNARNAPGILVLAHVAPGILRRGQTVVCLWIHCVVLGSSSSLESHSSSRSPLSSRYSKPVCCKPLGWERRATGCVASSTRGKLVRLSSAIDALG